MPKGVYTRKNKKTLTELKKRAADYQKEFKKRPESISKHTLWWREYRKTDKYKEYKKGYRARVKDVIAAERQNLKKEVMDKMGGKCVKCGFNDYRAVQIDHINGDGHADNVGGQKYYIRVLESFIKKEGKYQLLCANCNWIKRFQNNEHYKR